jgi:hypothetical protein
MTLALWVAAVGIWVLVAVILVLVHAYRSDRPGLDEDEVARRLAPTTANHREPQPPGARH